MIGDAAETGFNIEGRRVGRDAPPFVIAEMSGNHNQSLDRALKIVEAAAAAGAHALKIQTYTADTMTIDCSKGDFFIGDPTSQWHGRSLYELYQEAHTPWNWHKPIFNRARELGMIAFSTPFDESAVDFLETLDVPCYKIASFENTDLPLIRKVAATGKPILISIGMASLTELSEAVSAARETGCQNLVLLKCTSTYPASPENTNLRTIPHLRELFECETGLSDHTMGIGAAVAGVALGATVIEKHFTLARTDGGVDSSFSLEPYEMRLLVDEARCAWEALGKISYGSTPAEEQSRIFRRSIYACADIAAGEALSRKNIRIIRPGFGLPPKYLDWCLGRQARELIVKGTPISWDILC